jgi:hypothetical protein
MGNRVPYLGPNGGRSGGRVPYLGPQGTRGGRTPYLGQSFEPQPHSAPPHHGGGFFSRLGSDLYNTAIHSPSGLYEAGKAIFNPTLQGALHGHNSKQAVGARKQSDQLLKATVEGFKHDAEHPLRHPGNTGLDLLSLISLGAGTVARVGEAGRLARAGESAGEIGRGLVKGPKPQPRSIDLGARGKVDRGFYSRSASTRVMQKTIDRLQTKFPTVRFGLRNLPEKAGFERAQNERIRSMLANAPAHRLAAHARSLRLNNAQRLSVRVVAEEVPLETRIADIQHFLAGASGREKRLLGNHLKLLTQARNYVHDVETPDGRAVPRFQPTQAKLVDLYEHARKVATKRQNDLIDAGYLTHEGAQARVDAPLNLHEHGDAYPHEQHGQLHLFTEHGFTPDVVPELFGNRQGFYVSYRYAKNAKSLGRGGQLGVRDQIGVPQTDAELRNQFTGAGIKRGLVHPDTPKTVADSLLRSNRLLSLWRQRGELQRLAKDSVTDPKNDIPIRPIWLKNHPWPNDVRAYIQDLDNGTIPESEQDGLFEHVSNYVFPRDEHRAEHVGLEVPGVKWIDRRELGKLNLPGPLVGIGQHPGFARVVSFTDELNNAERAALLFAKPAYLPTNMLGNAALSLIQQGAFAPINLTKAVRLNHELGPELASRVDAVMGEGAVRSIGNEGHLGHRVIDATQRRFGAIVDTPFRRASFLHEARRAGYRSSEQVAQLLSDPQLEPELVRVARTANEAIIDYGRLGPVEQDVIRRIVFLYPWTKGATMYAKHFVEEHPTQAALVGQEGKQGAQRDEQLGPIPSYLDGVFPVGHRGNMPLVLNPNSVGVLNTPAQLAETLHGLVEKNPGEAFQFSQNLTPALQALQALADRGGVRRNHSAAGAVFDQLVTQLPAVTTAKGIITPPSTSRRKIYPRTRKDVILHYLLGGLAPSPLNQRAAERSAYLEKHGR